MKLSKFLFITLCLFIQTTLNSQTITVVADKTSGCDSVISNYSFSTTLPTVTSIRWEFGNNQTSNLPTPSISYKSPGLYSVKLVLNETDSVTNTDFINVGLTPQIRLATKDTLSAANLTFVLRAFITNGPSPFNYTYNWEVNGSTLAANTGFIVHSFDTAGLFPVSVRAIDVNGCQKQLDTSVVILDKIIVPNVFTPNNDGSNDEFIIKSNGINFLLFNLYTKTGQLVYKTTAKTIVWDGKMNTGEDVPEGIYYLTVEAIDATPPLVVKGFLYIYR